MLSRVATGVQFYCDRPLLLELINGLASGYFYWSDSARDKRQRLRPPANTNLIQVREAVQRASVAGTTARLLLPIASFDR